MADGGASIIELKDYGQWRSSSAAERYVANSMKRKWKAAKIISGGDEDIGDDDSQRFFLVIVSFDNF